MKILVIDDDRSLLRVLEHQLTGAGYQVSATADPGEGRERMAGGGFPLVFCDLQLPGTDGIEMLRFCRERSPGTVFVVITGHPSVDVAVEAMKLGAFDFLQKPVDRERLLSVAGKASEFWGLRDENRRLREIVEGGAGFHGLTAVSEPMRRLCERARQAAKAAATILITGETGTGKEVLARAIHLESGRPGPFVALNCGAIPRELIESELFGHLKGAFTGALADRPGAFRSAEGGTLFLDEIGDLSPELQTRLLRVLQEREVVPVGSNTPVKTDARVLCATHRDLQAEMAVGRFREDLYYRLAVVPLAIPPLRERRADIVPLFLRLLDTHALPPGSAPRSTPEFLKLMEAHAWPGNVRELENLARRALALFPGRELGAGEWEEAAGFSARPTNPVTSMAASTAISVSPSAAHLPDEGLDLEEWTDGMVRAALEKNSWNQSRTAKYLRVSRNTLAYRMEKRGIRPPSFP